MSGLDGPGAVSLNSTPRLIVITAVRLTGGATHEHITDVQWQSASSTGLTTRQALVEWLQASSANCAVVATATEHVPILVVTPQGGTPQLRTGANGSLTDHLLRLPRF